MTNKTVTMPLELAEAILSELTSGAVSVGTGARLRALIAAPAFERQTVALRYRANGDWELMDESPFADGRISHKEGGEELQPLCAFPPAPVSVDERAEFEKSITRRTERFHPDFAKYGVDGEYKHVPYQIAWQSWQDRACLDKVKEMNKSQSKMCDCNQGRRPCTCKGAEQ